MKLSRSKSHTEAVPFDLTICIYIYFVTGKKKQLELFKTINIKTIKKTLWSKDHLSVLCSIISMFSFLTLNSSGNNMLFMKNKISFHFCQPFLIFGKFSHIPLSPMLNSPLVRSSSTTLTSVASSCEVNYEVVL